MARHPRLLGAVALASVLTAVLGACATDTAVRSGEANDLEADVPQTDLGATDPTDDADATPTSDPPTTGDRDASDDPDVTGPSESDPPGTEPTTDEGDLDWAPCADLGSVAVSLECATLSVPLDHGDPGGPMIDIAVARRRASGAAAERIGSLVFNPGGPGGSGIEALEFVPLTMSERILDRFDLVGFDPRGVGASTALNCDNDVDDTVVLLEAGDDEGWQAEVDGVAEQLATCDDATMELAPWVGTNNAARDLELLRRALGDQGLSYVGYSYGTRLGATYAELFPESVRALVLDAGVLPSDDIARLDLEQAAGFDAALENFAAACDADADCVLQEIGPTFRVIGDLRSEIAEIGSFPTDDPDRVLTPGELELGIVASLYSKESWTFLASALFTAEVGQDGTLLQVLGDSLVGRQPDGTYDNSSVASSFINCADDPRRPTAEEQRVLSERAADASDHFAPLFRSGTGCFGLPASIDPLIIGPAAGAPPIVVIGNSGDPATPFAWSVALADELESAVLYTVSAEGHTAYGSIDCVQPEIDEYLLTLEVPPEGAGCSDNESADFFVPESEQPVKQIVAFIDCIRDAGVDIGPVTEADVLADPTLDAIFGSIDLGSPVTGAAILGCQNLLPES